jgi:hypothetical protein
MRAPFGNSAMIRYLLEPRRSNFVGVQHFLLPLECIRYDGCDSFTHGKIAARRT